MAVVRSHISLSLTPLCIIWRSLGCRYYRTSIITAGYGMRTKVQVSCVSMCQRLLLYSTNTAVSKHKNIDRNSLAGESKLLHFIGWLSGYYSRKSVLTRSAHSIYAQCVDEVDYESFFKVCAMPDTFQSWFIVAQLHIWLCLVRLKREDENGKFIIHHLVKFFWKDVQERLNLLGVASSSVKHQSIVELDKEFRGLIFAYEEGLLTDDKTLAAAVWRNFVHDKSRTDPVILSTLVAYIRSQVKEMDSTDQETLLTTGRMNICALSIQTASKV